MLPNDEPTGLTNLSNFWGDLFQKELCDHLESTKFSNVDFFRRIGTSSKWSKVQNMKIQTRFKIQVWSTRVVWPRYPWIVVPRLIPSNMLPPPPPAHPQPLPQHVLAAQERSELQQLPVVRWWVQSHSVTLIWTNFPKQMVVINFYICQNVRGFVWNVAILNERLWVHIGVHFIRTNSF